MRGSYLTVNHFLEDESRNKRNSTIAFVTENGETFDEIYSNRTTDIFIGKINSEVNNYAPFSQQSPARGSEICALGYPRLQNYLTTNEIGLTCKNLRRQVYVVKTGTECIDLTPHYREEGENHISNRGYFVMGGLEEGMSGGPAINQDGEICGILYGMRYVKFPNGERLERGIIIGVEEIRNVLEAIDYPLI